MQIRILNIKSPPLRLVLLVIIIVFTSVALRASGAIPDAHAGMAGSVSSGYSSVSGYYDPYLSPGFTVGLSMLYAFTLFNMPLVAEGEVLFSRYAMSESRNSRIDLYSLRGGTLYLYRLHHLFSPYGGVLLQESLVRFSADRIAEDDTALKPGAVFKAGFFSFFSYGLGSRIGIEYSVMPVSDRAFAAVTVTAGMIFSYAAFTGRSDGGGPHDAHESVERLVQQGRIDLQERNAAKAKESFLKVLSLDGNHAEAKVSLKRIGAAERYHARALDLSAGNQLYDAIPLLEQSSVFMRESGRELARLRGILAREIPVLEKSGISLYENNEYGRCITVMRKILLIDPENQTAKIYLPRAEQRLRAIERLK